MTWLRVALMVAAIWFLVAMPLVAWEGVQSIQCAYQVPGGGYGHPVEYSACVKGWRP